MKKLVFIFLISTGLFVSCVENPVEDPDVLPPPGNVTAEFDNQTFQSVTTVASITDVSMYLKATNEDGAFFKITLPESPIVGTYNWQVFDGSSVGFSLEYNDGLGSASYVAARDNIGAFANFPNYTDTAELVIIGIDRTNMRVSGTFRFTGVRFTDATQTAVETKVFDNGTFFNIPYSTSVVIEPLDDTVFLQQTIDAYTDGNVITTDYNYNGNRLVSIISNDAVDTFDLYFSYTGSLITKMEYKFEDGTVEQTETFEYDANNSLIAYKLVVPDDQGGYGFRYTYVYNADGTITGTKYIGDASSQEDLSLTETISFTDGEVTSIVTSTGSSYTYTYDTKNNPLRNVVGLSKIAFAGGEGNSAKFNLTREVIVNGLETNTYNYTYQYLPNNYPTQSIQDEGDGEYTTQYLYQ
jgi:hypothetical protein